MPTAKLILHEGQRAVVLPPDFQTESDEVRVEQRGGEIVVQRTPKPRFGTFTEIARYLEEKHGSGADFPEPPPRPVSSLGCLV